MNIAKFLLPGMSDKKTIVGAIILSLLLIGGGWYYSSQTPDNSVLPSSSPAFNGVFEPGISIGDPSAPVTLEEYTSFLCPACASFALTTLNQITNNYVKSGKVKLVFYIAAPYEPGEAALCAVEQNKFIEYHDYLFGHQAQITKEEDLKDMAINAGLDSSRFNVCYNSGKYLEKVTKWNEEAASRGVDSTPTFFINGQKFIGAQPYNDFKKIIDEKLGQTR